MEKKELSITEKINNSEAVEPEPEICPHCWQAKGLFWEGGELVRFCVNCDGY